ncbi:MAG TPA: hypothetical protein VEG34_01780 [Thermoanaerobaculia bacterium]|nr:hypothetical protein [Thermoanaerobaculia bacterium]
MRKISRRRVPLFVLLAVLALLPTLAQAGESAPPPDLDSAGSGPGAPAAGGGEEGASLDPDG